MDPLTLGIIAATAAVCTVAGVGLGIRKERNTSPPLREYRQLEQDRHQIQRSLDFTERYVENMRGDVQRVEHQRDEYRRMAETHEIQLPEIPDPVVQTGELWESRRFAGHPEANFRNLTAELQAAGVWDKEIHLRVEILGSHLGGGTGFAKAISGTWKRKGEPTKDIGPWMFHGTGERAVADLMTFLMDDDTGLTKPNPKSKKRKMWVDEDSPLVFKVDVAVTEILEPPKIPEIQIVEVPIVEERVIERIIEKEVFISIPAGQEPELCGHTKAEIRELVDDALARKVADDEVERISGLVRETDTETRSRLAQAALAKARSSN